MNIEDRVNAIDEKIEALQIIDPQSNADAINNAVKSSIKDLKIELLKLKNDINWLLKIIHGLGYHKTLVDINKEDKTIKEESK